MNFYHPHANHAIAKSNVQIEQHGPDLIEGGVEVLEAPIGDGIWHIKKDAPLRCMFNVLHCHQTLLCYKDNYQVNFY
jgi:hypothetical protein